MSGVQAQMKVWFCPERRPSAFLRVLAREALTRRQTCSLRRLLAPLVIILSRRSGQCTKGPRGPATLFAAFGSVQRVITSTFDEGGLSIPTDYTIQMSTGDPDPGSALLLPRIPPPPQHSPRVTVRAAWRTSSSCRPFWPSSSSSSSSGSPSGPTPPVRAPHLLPLPCDIRGA